ncbi:MAG TPA: glycosyltransferase family 2 protein [Patescibacteria group bacterium]|nr:glycosyltransferase family 2 protein [Patescibacteria group bacterium]
MNKKKVGVVLVNYKDYASTYLIACRDSLLLQNYGCDNFQVYIVDNASSPSSLKIIKEIYPEAVIIPRVDGNYCKANNVGFKKAISDGCGYLVTVNMDTEMDKGWLSQLVLALDSNEEAGVAQSKILLFEKNKDDLRINTLGNNIHFLGFGSTSCYKEKDRHISAYPEIKGYASGCSFITRKKVFNEVGGWNEDYYMYHDDIEFSLKTRLAGYKVILAPNSVIFHKYEFSRSTRMLYFMERNRYLLIYSFYPCYLIILLIPAILFMNLGMMFFAAVKGWFKIWLKVNLYFLKPNTWWKVFKFRRKIKKLKKGSIIEISKQMKGKLEFLEIDNFILRKIANPLLNCYFQFIKKII